MYCKDYVTIINGDNYTFTARNPFPFAEADLEIVEAAINSATYDIDPNKVAEEKEEKENTTETTTNSVSDSILANSIFKQSKKEHILYVHTKNNYIHTII